MASGRDEDGIVPVPHDYAGPDRLFPIGVKRRPGYRGTKQQVLASTDRWLFWLSGTAEGTSSEASRRRGRIQTAGPGFIRLFPARGAGGPLRSVELRDHDGARPAGGGKRPATVVVQSPRGNDTRQASSHPYPLRVVGSTNTRCIRARARVARTAPRRSGGPKARRAHRSARRRCPPLQGRSRESARGLVRPGRSVDGSVVERHLRGLPYLASSTLRRRLEQLPGTLGTRMREWREAAQDGPPDTPARIARELEQKRGEGLWNVPLRLGEPGREEDCGRSGLASHRVQRLHSGIVAEHPIRIRRLTRPREQHAAPSRQR